MSTPHVNPLDALKGGFRKACVKRLVGDESGVVEVLRDEIPKLVVAWAKSTSLEAAEKKAKELLCSVGLSERLQHKPGELSGGERQRTAIARALVTNPKCILADEPTGNLDEKSAREVFELIISLNKNLGSSLIMVTHNLELSKQADRVFELKEGKLYDL